MAEPGSGGRDGQHAGAGPAGLRLRIRRARRAGAQPAHPVRGAASDPGGPERHDQGPAGQHGLEQLHRGYGIGRRQRRRRADPGHARRGYRRDEPRLHPARGPAGARRLGRPDVQALCGLGRVTGGAAARRHPGDGGDLPRSPHQQHPAHGGQLRQHRRPVRRDRGGGHDADSRAVRAAPGSPADGAGQLRPGPGLRHRRRQAARARLDLLAAGRGGSLAAAEQALPGQTVLGRRGHRRSGPARPGREQLQRDRAGNELGVPAGRGERGRRPGPEPV